MFDMHHQITRCQRSDFGNHILSTTITLGAANQTVTQNILFGDHHQPVSLKPAFEPPNRCCGVTCFQAGDFIETGYGFE